MKRPVMTPVEFALILLSSYGICFGLMNDKLDFLSAGLRRSAFLNSMFNCAYCTGFHAGWFSWLFVRMGDPSPLAPVDGPEAVLTAFAAAAFCYAVDNAIMWLENHAHGS